MSAVRFFLILGVILAGVAFWAAQTAPGQDFVVERLLERAIRAPDTGDPDRLDVLVCGAASPLRPPGFAQACVAVRAGTRLFLVDAGAGSAAVLGRSGWALDALEGVFLTHFHSDHIADLPEVNLNSWVAGRPAPLSVLGPTGVGQVVAGFNEAFAQDHAYRTAHHGAALLPPALGVMAARTIALGRLDLNGGLTVRVVAVEHPPVQPAVAYRFDYRGRSVVVSGDTRVSAALEDLARGADVLLHDALSEPLVTAWAARLGAAGRSRMESVLLDVPDYHAHVDQLGGVLERTGVRQLVAYHLVPMPPNALLVRAFRRGLPEAVILAEDGMRIELPTNGTEVRVIGP